MVDRIIANGITFDDILLIPQRSDILPSMIDVSTHLTRRIRLNIPLVSAAMDTVTGAKLAMAIAQEGGIGVIHRNMSIEEQAKEVLRVKRFEAGIVTNPICLTADETVGKARQIMRESNISGIPITEGFKLVGIITARDLRIHDDGSKKIKDVMTKNLITAKVGVTLHQAKTTLNKHKIEKLLIVDNEFNLRGLITMKDIYKHEQNPKACKDSKGRLMTGAAIGVHDYDRAKALVESFVDFLAVDTAHGHSKNVIETIKQLKKKLDVDVIAGNIATKEAAKELIRAGADTLKVGIGPGSVCTTRIIAGIGVPQLTAVHLVSQEAKKQRIPVISDGGIRNSGDITKALAFGADCVMIGNLFACCTESPGETIIYKGRSYKTYRGMGSLGVLAQGSHDRYGQTQARSKSVPEGIEGMVPTKGALSSVIHQLIGGLQSGMGYCGVGSILELQRKAKFIKITPSSLKESHPHDIIITKEAPNYSLEAYREEPSS